MNWIARIFMGLLGLGLLAGLLLGLGVYIVYATMRWLITGRKPQVVLVWQQFRQMRQGAGMRWGGRMPQPSGTPAQRDGDVLDVQAREVRESDPRLTDDRPR